jgi:hypothetical protein
MNRRTIATTTPATRRVVHYIQPAARPADVQLYTAAQLATRHHEQQLAYARWAERQAAIADYDRKIRRFWFGFGATVALVLLAGCTAIGWVAYHAVTTATAGTNGDAWLGGLLIGALLLGGALLGGHRCITTITHRH